MKRILLVGLSVSLFILLFLLVKGEKVARPDFMQKGESFIQGLRIVNKRDGKTDWVLTALRADIPKSGDKAHLSGVEVKIQGKGVTVYADKGIYSMNDRKLTVDGKIVAKNDSYTLTSSDVKFDGGAGSINTNGPVEIEGKKFKLYGTGMDVDSNQQTVRIRRDVKAIFNR